MNNVFTYREERQQDQLQQCTLVPQGPQVPPAADSGQLADKYPSGGIVEKHQSGVPSWLSGLRIQHCHCCVSGHCCGSGSTTGQGTSTWGGCVKKNKTKTKTKKNKGKMSSPSPLPESEYWYLGLAEAHWSTHAYAKNSQPETGKDIPTQSDKPCIGYVDSVISW